MTKGKQMQQPSSKPIWVNFIKILSPLVIVGSLILNGLIIAHWKRGIEIPKAYIAFGSLGAVALITHALEAIVAGFMAKRQKLNPLQYGLYTFLVGTVAFLDLIEEKPTD